MATKKTPKREAESRKAAAAKIEAQQPADRALRCAVCDDAYTNRKMSISADPNEKVPVCSNCLGKALAMEKEAIEKANATKDAENEEEGASEPSGEVSGASEEKSEEE